MKMLIKRYKYFLVLLVINIIVYGLYPSVGQKSMDITWSNAVEMLTVIPPIFILLGLLDVWVQRETMIKLMGEKSGILGILIAFFFGFGSCWAVVCSFSHSGSASTEGEQVF